MKPLKYLLHGFVFAFGSAIILYGSIVDMNVFVPPRDIGRTVVFSVIAFFIILSVIYFLTSSLEVAGLVTSLLVLGLFYLWTVFLAILIIALVGLVSIRVFYKRLRYADVHLILDAISLAVVGFYLFRFVMMVNSQPWIPASVSAEPVRGAPETLSAQITAPDIYYIVLDGYGRADMLQAILGFDNSEFVRALEQRGFVVASRSQSSYPRTLLSLSSSLNMQYLDSISSAMAGSNSWWQVMDTMHHSEVRRILENLGYTTVFFENSWDYSDIRDGDLYEAAFPVQLNIFESLFWKQTNLKLLAGVDWLGIADPSYETQRQIMLFDFKTLPEVAKVKGPKFVFVHIIGAHPPYVFDHAGNPLDPPYPYTISAPESKTGYIEQVQFVNRLMLATIDGILAHSAVPPIIVIQGDHGPATMSDVETFETSCLYERFSILNAYYLPGMDGNSVPMDISPVNSFRFIFNNYFKSDLELLPNRQYISTNAHFYEFLDVTGQTEEACN